MTASQTECIVLFVMYIRKLLKGPGQANKQIFYLTVEAVSAYGNRRGGIGGVAPPPLDGQ